MSRKFTSKHFSIHSIITSGVIFLVPYWFMPKETPAVLSKVACTKDNSVPIKFRKAEDLITHCLCDFDNCNHNCTAKEATCKPALVKDVIGKLLVDECEAQCNAPSDGPSTNDIKLTEDTNRDPNATEAAATTTKGHNPTKDSVWNTGTDDSQPTADITEATGDDGTKPTVNSAKNTAEPAEETQKSTRKATTNNGNQRVVESNQFVFEIWILVTLVIRSFY